MFREPRFLREGRGLAYMFLGLLLFGPTLGLLAIFIAYLAGAEGAPSWPLYPGLVGLAITFCLFFDWQQSWWATVASHYHLTGGLSRIDGTKSLARAAQRHIERGHTANDIWRFVAALSDSGRDDRRRTLQDYGYGKFVQNIKAEPVKSDKWGSLYRIELWDDEPLTVIEVVEPKTGEHYFHRVPPLTRTPKHAVAWMWEIWAKQFAPMNLHK